MTDDTSPSNSITSISGGVNLGAERIDIGGDVVGRDKITVGYTSEQVSAILTQISTQFQAKPFDGHCPYKGLDVFEEEDAEFFFGRETLIEDLVGRVKQSRTVFITGPSGSGKSSLVRAGLIHTLKRGAISGSEHWRYEALKPGRSPLDELARVASSLAGSLNAGEDIRTKGPHDATTLQQWVEVALKDQRDRRAVIFIDQFEEVFTQVAKEDVRIAFLNLLTQAATMDNGRVIVLFAMRSDFVSNCATYPQLNALLNQQFLQVGAMQPDELVSAIAQPALRVGLKIDPALVAQIINEMEGEPGALPLMQFALKDLFDSQQAKGGVSALTLPDYLTRGGIHKALERHADAAFAQFSEEEQQMTRQVFGGLIQVGRGTPDTRRIAMFDELVSAEVDKARVELVVQKLADARLITTDEADGKDTVTISHEKLIDAWPWLRKLVDENRDAIALQNQIAEDAQEWVEHQRDPSYLYVGARLANAQEQLAAKNIMLSGTAQTFVEAGIDAVEAARRREAERAQKELDDARQLAAETEARRQAEAQRRQDAEQAALRLKTRNRVITAAVVVAVLLAILAGVFGVQSTQLAVQNQSIANAAQTSEAKAVSEAHIRATAEISANIQRDEAERQQKLSRSRELTAIAQSQIDIDPERSLLIAIEAGKVADTYEAQDVLRQLLAVSRLRKAVLRGHDDRVWSAQFSPDGQRIVTASDDKTARVWEAATGKELAVLRGHADWTYSAEFSPDGKQIVTASKDKTARVWDATTGEELAVLRGHEGEVNSAQFSPDGKQIVTASADGTARVWAATTGQELAVLRGHGRSVYLARFSPDGKQIVTASDDQTARVWDAVTGQPLAVLRGHEYWVDSAQFSPDGKQIVTASWDQTARVWDAATGQPLAVLHGHAGEIYSAQFSPDGKQIVTASRDGTARVWDVSTTVNVGAASGQELALLRGHEGPITRAQFSPDGQRIVTASDDQTARVWDAATGQQLVVLRGHDDVVVGAQFSPDGKQIVTASYDKSAQVWEAATGKPLAVLRGHEKRLHSAQFSLDGKKIVTASDDMTARVWDAATGQQLAMLRGHENGVTSAQFSPDGKQIVTASRDKTARVWDAATGQVVAVLSGSISAQFSPDGQRIVTSGCEKVDANNNCTEGTVRVWEAATGQQLAVLHGHEDWVNSAQFSPDGKQIVTASDDKTARVWDAATGKELAVLRGHEDWVWSAQSSPDGKYIVTASQDGTARIYVVRIEDLIALAQSRVARLLTCQERVRYFQEDIVCPTPTP